MSAPAAERLTTDRPTEHAVPASPADPSDEETARPDETLAPDPRGELAHPDCPQCLREAGLLSADEVVRPAKGELLQGAASVLGVVLLVVTPFVAWWALGRWTSWDLPARLGASVAACVVAALAPIYLSAYAVTRRRRFREVDAEVAALYPEHHHEAAHRR